MIEIDDDERTQCGNGCAFLADGECLLFNTPLDDITLPPNYEWQDGQQPFKERCWRCFGCFGCFG